MKKILLLCLLLPCFCLSAQNEFDLLPANMIKYLGKVNREQFEEKVGEPVGYEEDFIVYEVINTYGNRETAIRCLYRESDGKLISVKFGTPVFLGYCIDFGQLKGYNYKLHQKVKEDSAGNWLRVDYKLNGFGMQVLDITEVAYQEYVARINYHIVK